MREWSCCLINILANSQYCFQLLKFNDPLYLCFHTIQKPSIAKLKQLSKAESVFYNIQHQWESSIKVSSAKINSFQTSNRDNILVNHQSESQLILTLTVFSSIWAVRANWTYLMMKTLMIYRWIKNEISSYSWCREHLLLECSLLLL